MEIIALVIVLTLLGFLSGILIVSGIRKIIFARKSNRVSYKNTTIAAIGNQQNLMTDTPTTLGESLRFLDGLPKKRWVTPHVVEESTLEFTGIRAIQL